MTKEIIPEAKETKPPRDAVQFMNRMRRATRRKFTAEEKIRIILEGMKREIPISDLCRRERIHPTIYYSWLKDFMEAGKSRLRGDTHRQANNEEVHGLKRENGRLKTIVADQMLENTLLKKSLSGLDEGGIGR